MVVVIIIVYVSIIIVYVSILVPFIQNFATLLLKNLNLELRI